MQKIKKSPRAVPASTEDAYKHVDKQKQCPDKAHIEA